MKFTNNKPAKEGFYWAKWLCSGDHQNDHYSKPQVVAVSMSYLNLREHGLSVTHFGCGGDIELVADCDYLWSDNPISPPNSSEELNLADSSLSPPNTAMQKIPEFEDAFSEICQKGSLYHINNVQHFRKFYNICSR